MSKSSQLSPEDGILEGRRSRNLDAAVIKYVWHGSSYGLVACKARSSEQICPELSSDF